MAGLFSFLKLLGRVLIAIADLLSAINALMQAMRAKPSSA